MDVEFLAAMPDQQEEQTRRRPPPQPPHRPRRQSEIHEHCNEPGHTFRDMEDQILLQQHQQQIQYIRDLENAELQRHAARQRVLEMIYLHQRALDDLVNVNTLFTKAVFIGLALAQPGQRSLETRVECVPGNDVGKRLVVFEVLSFSCFLLSSMLAKTLKVHLNIYKEKDFKDPRMKIARGILLMVSAWGSILGYVFLVISMVLVIQIKVGKLSCGGAYSVRAVSALVSIVGIALVIYVPFMMHAIYTSMKQIDAYKL